MTAPTSVPSTTPAPGADAPADGVPAILIPPAPGEFADLGFGRVVAQSVRGRFFSHDGTPISRKYGLGAQRADRLYRASLNAPWTHFLAWTLGAMLLVNGCFALAYVALGPQAIDGAASLGMDDPFLRAFSFSVGIFTTTGAPGGLHPVGSTANWLAILETFVGIAALVTVAGLLIARLTRPRMRLRFSESAVVAPYEGGRGLMFRIVNVQAGELTDVQVRVALAWFEETNGRRERVFHQLALERSSVEFFTLHWTLVHPIRPDSPLAGMTPESLHAAEAEFMVSVNAHEETFSTRVTTRASYLWDEVRWDVKFASVFASAPDGVLAIDVDRLDRTERLPEGTTSVPAACERTGAVVKVAE